MPSYPTSVVSFTTHNPGDTIASADINSIQSEVAAIEAGITQGSAPLNSSNSTVANLSVTGNSTIAGSLAVASLTVGGSSPLVPQACRLSNTTDQAVSSGTWTGLNWDNEVYDPNNMHSTASNSSRITFAGSSGLYAVGATAQWHSIGAGSFAIRIMLNDAVAQCGQYLQGGVSSLFGVFSVTGTVRATSTTDYVTVQVYEDGSTNSVIGTGTVSSTLYGTWFWAAKIG